MARLGRSQPYLALFSRRQKLGAATIVLSGTILGASETDIVTGGRTIILTLTGDTWVAAGSTFDAQRQNIINGLTSAQAEATGWNAVVKATAAVTDVVRTSASVVTITLEAFATYNITVSEVITATVPGTALLLGGAIVAAPTFTITAVSAAADLSAQWVTMASFGPTLFRAGERRNVATFVPAKASTQYICFVSLVSQANTKVMQVNPTIAAGDFKVSIDGGALANLGTLPTVTPAGSMMVKITLSTSEMAGANATVVCSDAAGAEWCDLVINIPTAARQIDDLAFPATTGRSMVVDAAGLVDANMVKAGASGAGNTITTSGGVTLPAGTVASTTNITSGTITTVSGNVNGSVASVTGAVGSVTGAVGSVTGAVGSVTGNVGGNVVGSVGSVVGAVGSVTGNVGGSVASVTGAVGSVTGNVGGNVVGSVASVAGNVSGNVVGSVGSVVGAVGSVTGNVGGSVATVTGAVGSVTGNVGGNLVGSVGSLTNTAVDNILDRTDAVETGLTPRGAFRLNAAASAGVLAGAATSTITIRNAVQNSKTRITATVDGSGNRSAITTDVT